MAHYIVSFIVYTCAMSGLIALALFVYKKVTNISSTGRKTKMLSVEEVLNINPRKYNKKYNRSLEIKFSTFYKV